ncbi:MAG: ATP-binding protein [Verrucomicrobiia bacterium]
MNKLLERLGRLGTEDLQRHLVGLAQDKGFFETIFNSLQEGVLVLDPAGRISFLNPAASQLFGLELETSVGRSIEERLPGVGAELRMEGGRNVTRDIEIFYPQHRILNFYGVPLRIERSHSDEPGGAAIEELVGHAIILRDITESLRKSHETIESERLSALTLLAAGVAHELGNPLNSLHIHLQLIERRARRLPEGERERLLAPVTVARDEIKRLDLIVTQFLNAIRPSRLTLERQNLNDIVAESISFLSAEIRGKKIAITQKLRSDLPLIPLDRTQIKQAFYNILKNSFQALKDGGSITVRTDLVEDDVVVEFIDTGEGIDAAHMGRIFEPYFTTKKAGSGLGLLIVRRIVREHGGDIALESAAGEGTTVRLRFPTGERRVRFLEGGPSMAAGADTSIPKPAERDQE